MRITIFALVLSAACSFTGCASQPLATEQAYIARSDGTVSVATRSALDGSPAPGRQEILAFYLPPIPGIPGSPDFRAGITMDPSQFQFPIIISPPQAQAAPYCAQAAPSCAPQTVEVEESCMEPETVMVEERRMVPQTRMVPRTRTVRKAVIPVPQAAPVPYCAPAPQKAPGCEPVCTGPECCPPQTASR